MVDRAATGGGSIAGRSEWIGIFDPKVRVFDPSMESSVVFRGTPYGSVINRGGTPSASMLGFEERIDAMSREMRLVRLLIHNISQQQDIQLHEIRQMRELVHGLSRQLESTGDSDPESGRDELDLDYQSMEELAQVESRPSVNWKGVSKATPYPEMFNIQYELDSEET